jgi:hypothetical protein
MNRDTRNTRIVIALIFSMTAGAQLLLWLEPGTRNVAAVPALTASGGVPIEEVIIEYAPAGEIRTIGVDCHLLPDGRLVGTLEDPRVRLVVVGTDSESLTPVQQRSLLAAIGNMSPLRRPGAVRIRLDRDSDVTRRDDLPPQARDLRNLLVRKDLID